MASLCEPWVEELNSVRCEQRANPLPINPSGSPIVRGALNQGTKQRGRDPHRPADRTAMARTFTMRQLCLPEQNARS